MKPRILHPSPVRGRGILFAAVLALGLVAASLHFFIAQSAAQLVSAPEESGLGQNKRFTGPTSSQPLALTANDAFYIAVANPDNNTVAFRLVRNDRNRQIAEVPVQTEPNGVAFLPNGTKAYAANTVSGTVFRDQAELQVSRTIEAIKHIEVGTEPYGLALTPTGKKLYVFNFSLGLNLGD